MAVRGDGEVVDLPVLFSPGEDLSWVDAALCAQVDPELWYPERGGSAREAKQVCGRCDVRAECLDYALRHDERYGIWGGTSERERRRMLRAPDIDNLEEAV